MTPKNNIKLYSLSDYNYPTGKSKHYSDTIRNILKLIKNLTKSEFCTLRLVNHITNELELAATYGLKNWSKLKGKTIYIGDSCIGRAVKQRKIIKVDDIKKSKIYKFPKIAEKFKLKSLIAFPIISRGIILGGITIYSKGVIPYDMEKIETIKLIVDQAGIAMENETLYRDSISALHSLSTIIESKDNYTKGHSSRVTILSVAFAKYLRIDKHTITILERITPLHDVGKVAIPTKLLKKNANLTKKEMGKIKMHPIIGYNIVKPIRMFKEGLAIIRNHHERYDGTGYPDQLKGKGIPKIARIVALADAFDAIVSERSYKPPYTTKYAIEEILNNAGTQFDPKFAKKFVEFIKNKKSILSKKFESISTISNIMY